MAYSAITYTDKVENGGKRLAEQAMLNNNITLNNDK